MALSFATKMGEWHLPKILEQGSKFVPNDMTPEDAQMLLSRKYTVDDIARWLGVPRLMLENSDPSFGNAEQFTQNFIDFFMGPWLSLWEYAIRDQLIIDPDRFFAQFTRQALVRGNFKDRVDGLTSMVNAGHHHGR
jgi:phage portal protein BeeE